MLARLALAGALAVAALVPAAASAASAAAGEPPCRIVIDPRTVYTPVGSVVVPMVYCVNP